MGMMDIKIKDGDDVKVLCDTCGFGCSYTSDGNLTRVCDSVHATTKERHLLIEKASETNKCDMYEEGHQLWLEMKKSGLGPCDFYVSLPPEKKYRFDKSHSDTPVFACNSYDKHCLHGNSKIGCYWKTKGCSSQMCLDDPTKMADAESFKEIFEGLGIDTSKIDYLN